MIPKRLLPGDQFDQSARTHGEFTDAVEELRSRQLRGSRKDEHSYDYIKGTTVNVLNSSGQGVPWYGVLELGTPRDWDGLVLDAVPFRQKVYLNGVAPNSVVKQEPMSYGIAQGPIGRNRVGRVLIGGVTQARVYIEDEDALEYKYASPIEDNVKKLVAKPGGLFRIVWSEGKYGTGEEGLNWALIWLKEGLDQGLIRFQLAENHPGRNSLFDVWIGEWNPATHAWDYDCDTTYKCIDHHYDVPYPNAGATGLGQWRSSDTYSKILETVSLDCDTPGTTC